MMCKRGMLECNKGFCHDESDNRTLTYQFEHII